jgi:nicotinamidase-related amidase
MGTGESGARLPANTALLIIDLQYAIDDARWRKDGDRNNPQAERNISTLLAAWRARDWPRIHIRHDSTFADSPYRPGQPGNAFKAEAQPLSGERVIGKRTNSAFIGTNLEQLLRSQGIGALVIAGVITNNSVEATVRMAGNLGFTTFLAEDAVFTFARRDRRGRLWSADDVHALSLANMDGEYCSVLLTSAIVTAMA